MNWDLEEKTKGSFGMNLYLLSRLLPQIQIIPHVLNNNSTCRFTYHFHCYDASIGGALKNTSYLFGIYYAIDLISQCY